MAAPRPTVSGLRRWEALGLTFLPGLLAGSQLAGLLFFLNPQVPFGVGPLLRGIALLGVPPGLLTMAIAAPFVWRRPGIARSLLPWAITAELAVLATLYWLHASRYAYFVPPGINVRLIKAASWLTLGALICFYTALVHALQKRPYSGRSRWGLVLVGVLSVVVLIERREAFEPEPATAPLPSAFEPRPHPELYVIGLDSATLDAILPLARQGQLPFFSKLIEEGAYGRVSSLSPIDRSALWTSLGTGKFPYRHGVLGDTFYAGGLLSPDSILRLLPGGVRLPASSAKVVPSWPAGSRSRLSLTGWEILDGLGQPAGVVGWPATFDPNTGLSFAYSSRYFEGDFTTPSAQPQELAERGVLFSLGIDEIDPAVVEPFGPEVPHDVLQALAGDLWRESLGTFLLEQRSETKALFMVLPGLREVSKRYYGAYSALQFEGSQSSRRRREASFVAAYYRHLDGFLARLLEREGEPRLLAVVSAHGVRAPSGWKKLVANLSNRSSHGTFDPSADGVFFLSGDGIARGRFLERVSLIDVLPTLLYAMGFPIAQDLDGRVLTSAFEGPFLTRHPLTFIPSYETLAAEEGAEPAVAAPPLP